MLSPSEPHWNRFHSAHWPCGWMATGTYPWVQVWLFSCSLELQASCLLMLRGTNTMAGLGVTLKPNLWTFCGQPWTGEFLQNCVDRPSVTAAVVPYATYARWRFYLKRRGGASMWPCCCNLKEQGKAWPLHGPFGRSTRPGLTAPRIQCAMAETLPMRSHAAVYVSQFRECF